MSRGIAVVLSSVAMLAGLCPPSDAARARTREWSADRYAADHGLALPLAAALHVLRDGERRARGWSRLLASHPPVDRRIDALQGVVDRAPARTRPPQPSRTAGEPYSNRYSNAIRTGANSLERQRTSGGR